LARTGALALTLALLIAVPLRAQTLTQGAVDGVVRDPEGKPLSGVVVTLRDRTGFGSMTRTSGKDGRFMLGLLPPGQYDLLLEALGYQPLRIRAIPVRAGNGTRLDYVLSGARTAAAGVVERRYGAAFDLASEQLSRFDAGRFPEQGRLLTSTLRLSSNSNAQFETEGLPAALNGVRLDGLPVTPMLGSSVTHLPMTIPLSIARDVELLLGNADVEWSGSAGPLLSAHSAVAGNTLQFSSFGDWSSGSLNQGGLTAPDQNGVRAGGVLSAPIVRDTAGLVAGVEFWRLDAPIAFAPGVDSVSGLVLDAAQQRYGITDARLAPTHLARTTAVSGFARLDWLVGATSRLHFSSAMTALPRAEANAPYDHAIGARSSVEGADLHLAGGLDTRLGERFGQQLRVAWSRSVRDYTDPARSTPAHTTWIVADALALGDDPLQTGRRESQAVRARATMHYWGTRHHIKGGVAADLSSYDADFGADRATGFWFSDPAAFASGSGYAVHRRGFAEASFNLPRVGLFLQDEWSVGPRARMLFGLRWDYDKLPADRFRLNGEWLRLTGITIDSLKPRHGRIAPRFEFEWQPDAAARWTLRASGGVWDAEIDPALLAEAIAYNGSAKVRRDFGHFDAWPTTSDSGAVPILSLLTTGFQAPRSTRFSAGISRTIVPGIDVSVAFSYRRTEFLPRRSDANLLGTAAGQDQYGRPIYGSLEKQGGVLGAEGGSDRRFAQYDRVSVTSVDGWSEYRGISAALHAQPDRRLLLHAQYTWSRTEDNWFMARSGLTPDAIVPLRENGGSEWSESLSDFDTPHRLVLGAEVSSDVLGGIRAAALYRYRSGYPFTPGFRDGVDANADGSMRNDPAFIDPDLPGFAAVADAHACIRTQVGRFAGRNSCRADAERSVDLRLAIGLYRTETRSAEIVLDALNLFASGAEFRDHALLLVDPNRELVHDGTTTRVPLVLNPAFGAPLLRTTPGEMFRIGIRVTR